MTRDSYPNLDGSSIFLLAGIHSSAVTGELTDENCDKSIARETHICSICIPLRLVGSFSNPFSNERFHLHLNDSLETIDVSRVAPERKTKSQKINHKSHDGFLPDSSSNVANPSIKDFSGLQPSNLSVLLKSA